MKYLTRNTKLWTDKNGILFIAGINSNNYDNRIRIQFLDFRCNEKTNQWNDLPKEKELKYQEEQSKNQEHILKADGFALKSILTFN